MTDKPESITEVKDASPEVVGGVEAVLFSTDRPASAERIAEALGLIAPADDAGAAREREAERAALATVEACVGALNAQYEQAGRAFRIELVPGGYRVMTLARYAPVISAFDKGRVGSRLSRQAVETLAVVAYRQPVTRAELEAIRGVSCGEVLRSLIERRLVTVRGRAEELGRPLLYGTTRAFLEHFGLASIADLPKLEELRAPEI